MKTEGEERSDQRGEKDQRWGVIEERGGRGRREEIEEREEGGGGG